MGMTASPQTERILDAASELGGLGTGLGIWTFALFPIAVPLLVLTFAPVIVLGLLLALPVALIAGLALLLRKIGRSVRPPRLRSRNPRNRLGGYTAAPWRSS